MLSVQWDADVIVVGLGAMGSNAAWRLAARGVSVVGIERFHPGHVQGSTHGLTRIFRVACLEHPNLVPLARRSRDLFVELEEQSGRPTLRESGAVMIGPESSEVIAGTLAAAEAHDLPIERLDRAALADRFPTHAAVGDDHVGVWDPEAGLAFPEHVVIAAVDAARAAGAEIHTDTRVSDIELVDGGVRVATSARTFTARQAIVTTGPWLAKLVPELPLDPQRTPMMWFDERVEGTHGLDDFPVFIRAIADDQWMWGHGAGDGFGVKIGPEDEHNFVTVDPDAVDRYISARDWEHTAGLVGQAFPGLEPVPARVTTCIITRSPDGQFQIGRPHGDPRLVVGGGGSGHGFKHAAGIGELLAQIACDEPTLVPTDFVDPNRFL